MSGRDDAPATYFVLSLIALDLVSEAVDDNVGSGGEELKYRALLYASKARKLYASL